MKIGERFEGQTRDCGIKNPTDHPMVFWTYQGWEVGDRALTLPPHSAVKLMSAGSPECCACLQVVAL